MNKYATLDMVAAVLRKHAKTEFEPGMTTKLIKHLSPDDQRRVGIAAGTHLNELDLGRHGDPTRVSKVLEVPQQIVDKVAEGLEVDDTVRQLGARMGTDADLPLPELTRADQLRAALDAHNFPEE